MQLRNFFGAFLLIPLVVACAGDEVPASDGERLPAPLFDNLGSFHREITTSEETAQRYFDQGLILTYGFNHAEAIRSFEAAIEIDPQCAMCFWGIAFALGPNINLPLTEEVPARRAYAAVKRARGLSDRASEVDQALTHALVQRYLG